MTNQSALPWILAGLLFAGGCLGAPVDHPSLNCWGNGDSSTTEECRAGLAPGLVALGLQQVSGALELSRATDGCGPVIECAIPTPVPEQAAAEGNTASSPPRATDSVVTRRNRAQVTEEAERSQTSATTPPAQSQQPPSADERETPPQTSPTRAQGPDSCRGVNIEDLQAVTQLMPQQLLCLTDTALGRRQASDTQAQIAAIGLYNVRSTGWQEAVEVALRRPGLNNAPQLNFAGIKPAYDSGRFQVVLARSRIIWQNLDKGYQLGANDRAFLVEFACRSAGQVEMNGQSAPDGLTWCERWLDRARRSGASTGEIQDLIDQLE